MMKLDFKKISEFGFVVCEFKSGGEDDCECGKSKKGDRLWYLRTCYEYDEGDYACDKCVMEYIEARESQWG